MTSFFFWNVMKKDLREVISLATAEREVDILLLAECGTSDEEMAQALREATRHDYTSLSVDGDKIRIFTRLNAGDWSRRQTDALSARMVIWRVSVGKPFVERLGTVLAHARSGFARSARPWPDRCGIWRLSIGSRVEACSPTRLDYRTARGIRIIYPWRFVSNSTEVATPETIPNLWPEQFKIDVQTPYTILRVQATFLSRVTRGILEGVVETERGQKQVQHRLVVVAPAVNAYRHTLIVAIRDVNLAYPAEVRAAGLAQKETRHSGKSVPILGDTYIETVYPTASNDEQMVQLVQRALQSEQTQAVILSLIARSNEAQQPTLTATEDQP